MQTLSGLRTSDFDYALPPERIAQTPIEPRDASRLLHLCPDGVIEDRRFSELPQLLNAGDLVVVNQTRVRAARLLGAREDGGDAEVLLLRRLDGDVFSALVRPGRRLHAGATVRVADELRIDVLAREQGHPGARTVAVHTAHGTDVEASIARHGQPPLPPYIHQKLTDPARYETVYASGSPASAAAPTAGLHFSNAVRDALAARGIGWATLELEVGLGTFAPITAETVEAHRMHEERFVVPDATVAAIEHSRAAGGRVVAVGTTVVRALESCAANPGRGGASGATQLFITPGHRFRSVDGLLTNFHQPRSSLLVLLASFIGVDEWRRVYEHALSARYRFLSFGDCMLCWRP